MQHHSSDFAPVSTLCIRVEQAQIRDDVLLVVDLYRLRGCANITTKRKMSLVTAPVVARIQML
jgi:hypothetical protein